MFGIIFLLASVSGAGWTEDLEVDLVSYYKLDETSGDVIDSHGSNDGTNNGATRGVTGKINNAYDFDGTNDYVIIDTAFGIKDTDKTISMWINLDRLNEIQNFLGQEYPTSEFGNIKVAESNRIEGTAHFSGLGSTTTLTTNTWYHVVAIVNDTLGTSELFINGVSEDTGSKSTVGGSEEDVTLIGNGGSPPTYGFGGTIDEVGIWSRALTSDEISDLYNSGDGLSYGSSASTISITLNSPSNESTTSETSINFTGTYNISTGDYNWTNATYFIYYDNGTIFNNSYTEVITGVDDTTTREFSNFSIIGDYYWNIYACYENSTGYAFCNWNDEGNYTFTVAGDFSSYVYNTSILETARGYFSVDLTIPDGTSIQAGSGKLIYNGTSYSSITVTNNGDNNYTISKEIYIPIGTPGFDSYNRTFFWNITIVDTAIGDPFVQSSSTQTHQVNELYFGLCDSTTYLIPVLNFTMIDEADGTQINGSANATTFQATFLLGACSSNLLKNYTIDNISVTDSEFDFCTANYTSPFYADMEAFYTAAGYVDKQYFFNNATLTNTTNEINLYLLDEDDALEFFISVEQDLDPVTDATINIEKYFVGEGIYKTVEIDETDTDGELTSFLDLDKKYRFTISKDGSVLGIINKRASCYAAPCEILLSLESESDNPFSNFDTAFASNVLYNLSFNPNTKIVTFDFVDTTGLATYFRMVVYNSRTNQSSIIIYDNSMYSSSGQMTFNATGYSGDFYVETYISRSPETLIDFITFIINDIAEQLGLIGLFTSLILILVVIFSLSMKPSMLVMAVPLALTTFKLMGFISLNTTSIIFIYVLAFIALFALSK